MNLSALLFRFRVPIITVLITLGFWAPWSVYWNLGTRTTLLEWLGIEISRTGLLSFSVATPVVIVVGSLIAAAGAALRIWGTAYLGAVTVNHSEMQADGVMAAGPYRYVRNPLYLGSILMMAAMAFIMPVSGAVFTMVSTMLVFYALIHGEEPFLLAKLGEPYRAYLATVPRILPMLRTRVAKSDAEPNWTRSVLSELNPVGVFITLAFFSWTYNHWLMVQAILVSFGISIIARAFIAGVKPQPA